LFDLLMAPVSQGKEPPQNPGRFNLDFEAAQAALFSGDWTPA
jgi:hypothetical protein